MDISALLLTVGGSPEPLMTAVRDLEPQRVIFFASKDTEKWVDGQGTPVERRRGAEVIERLPNLITLMGLQGRYEKGVFQDMDDLQGCYQQVMAKGLELKQAGLREVHIDYTGGTKTMSAAILLAAVDEDWEI